MAPSDDALPPASADASDPARWMPVPATDRRRRGRDIASQNAPRPVLPPLLHPIDGPAHRPPQIPLPIATLAAERAALDEPLSDVMAQRGTRSPRDDARRTRNPALLCCSSRWSGSTRPWTGFLLRPAAVGKIAILTFVNRRPFFFTWCSFDDAE